MADYFTNFSFILLLPTAEAQTYALELHHQGSSGFSGDDLPKDFPHELKDQIEDWCFEAEADHHEGRAALWLHSSNGGIDAVCAFVSHLLEKFEPDGFVNFEWSNDCSKPRTDAYGGGAAIITATAIRTMSTCEWLQQNSSESKPGEHLFSPHTRCCVRCGQHADDAAIAIQSCPPLHPANP